MKINKLFHWLYFFVMVLPLVLAPIFAVYSHRHTLTEQTQVDIQYKYQSNDVNSIDDLVNDNIYLLQCSDYSIEEIVGTGGYITFECLDLLNFGDNQYANVDDTANIFNIGANTIVTFEFDGSDNYIYIYTSYEQLENYDYNVAYIYNGTFTNDVNIKLIDFVIDNYYYHRFLYTDYNEVESVNVNDETSDIMSVFVGNYANAIDKYFNYDRAFNFGDLYTWLNTTFFNSNAPLGFFIFWHLLIYWLLTSILWLVFDVLMYVPQLVHRWLDKASIS